MGACETSSDAMRIDFDSVWKDTTEVYFAALLELFEPQALPKVPDHEPLSFLDQEMQQLAQVLGDEGGPDGEMGVGADPGGNPGGHSDDGRTTGQSRRERRRARRSSRLRVDKLVRVPLPVDARGAGEGLGPDLGPSSGLDPDTGAARAVAKSAPRSVAKAKSASKTRRARAANDTSHCPAKTKPAYWLAHIEVQTQRDSALPRRLLDYHYHIERRHRCRVITFVILGDLSPSWRPGQFSSDVPPLGMSMGYLSLKLIDLELKLELPRFRGNPVAMVVRAHLAALRTRHDLEARCTQRVALCRRLYEEGFSRKDVVFIHGLIDRLMILPRPLMIRFRQEILAMEKDKNMPYLDSISRMCREEGVQEGSLAQARESVIEVLEIRFGEISTELHERINALDNLRTLKAQLRRAITVPSLDQF